MYVFQFAFGNVNNDAININIIIFELRDGKIFSQRLYMYYVHYTTSQMLCTLSLSISVFCNRINENRVNAFIELIKMLANNILKTYRL